MGRSGQPLAGISAIVPTYNSAAWLPATLRRLDEALRNIGESEIVVVDDGSDDDTIDVLAALATELATPLRVVSQENRGRFLARWTGIQEAKFARLFFVDSRVTLAPDALDYVLSADAASDQTWVAHVDNGTTSLLGHFWEAPTHVFWGKYLRDPQPSMLTTENFDQYPKGTGCLLVDRAQFEKACLAAWPDADQKLVSDDTRILRHLVEQAPLRLDPGFRAEYEPRIRLSSFLSHAFDRGTLFVDSYAGTSGLRNVILVLLVVAPLGVLIAAAFATVMGAWLWVLGLLVFAVSVVSVFLLVAIANRCRRSAVVSFLVFFLPFGMVFWAGLARGLVIHRHAFSASRKLAGQS
ncbi:MAG: glycosyltransferase family A protein [Rhodoglobus sp.]